MKKAVWIPIVVAVVAAGILAAVFLPGILRDNRTQSLMQQGEEAEYLGDYDAALACYSQILESIPDHAEALSRTAAIRRINGNRAMEEGRFDLAVEEFEKLTGTESGAATEVDSYSQQLFSGVANSGNPLRADFMRLRDSTGRELGDLFVYTDASEEIDLLTGFHSWDHFRQYVRDNPETFRHPCAVAQFDINSMG